MNLVQCPYDAAQLDVEVTVRASLLFVCGVCDAAWERDGGWIGRVRGPDRAKVIDTRRHLGLDVPRAGEPLPMFYATRHGVEGPTGEG